MCAHFRLSLFFRGSLFENGEFQVETLYFFWPLQSTNFVKSNTNLQTWSDTWIWCIMDWNGMYETCDHSKIINLFDCASIAIKKEFPKHLQ